MSNELEALDSIMNTLCQRQMDLLADGTITVDEYDVIMKPFFDGNKLLKKALTPPTQEEVCEALKDFFKNSKYHNYIDTVYYSEKGKYFYTEDEQRNLIEMIFDNYYVHEIPPHLIILIGRFYEGLGK